MVALPYDRPFQGAIDWLRGRIPLDTTSASDIRDDEHDAVFVVAGAKGAMLSDIQVALDRALVEGRRIEDFAQDFEGIVGDWDGRGVASGWRARLVYQTNMRTAYGRGREDRQFAPAAIAAQPYVQASHSDALHPRPLHKAMDGKVFRKVDVPFSFPNGYGCGCRWLGLTQGQVDRRGLQVESLSRGDVLTYEGERIPLEPDPGWDVRPTTDRAARREAALRNIAARSTPEVRASLLGFLSRFLLTTITGA
jgi:hypothetical protein